MEEDQLTPEILNIEVNYQIINFKTNTNTMTQLKELAKDLSLAEIKQLLKEKESATEKETAEARKKYQLEVDEFTEHIVKTFTGLHNQLKTIKKHGIERGLVLYDQMFVINGKDPKKEQKSRTIQNTAGTQKVVIEYQEVFDFKPEAEVGINSIKEFFKSKFSDRSKQVYNLLDALLIRNRAGEYDPRLLSKLRAQVIEINNEELTNAFKILEENQYVSRTSTYIRAYQMDESGKWKDIVLSFSSL